MLMDEHVMRIALIGRLLMGITLIDQISTVHVLITKLIKNKFNV